jgi:hypothetical protein
MNWKKVGLKPRVPARELDATVAGRAPIERVWHPVAGGAEPTADKIEPTGLSISTSAFRFDCHHDLPRIGCATTLL